MKIAVAVVVGVALLGVVGAVRADDTTRARSEICLDDCDFVYEKCQAREGSKGAGRCNIEIVRCKNACPPAPVEDATVPTVKTHAKCVDRCRATYKACLGKPENKRGGSCAADDMRCEKACPAPPEVAAPVAPPAEPGRAPVAAPAPAPTRDVKSKPRAAARVEGAAAPAPAAATPAATVGERPGTQAPTVRSEGVAEPATAPAGATAATRPSQEERGFFGKIGCFFVSCEPAGSTPCLQECATAYDECHARESKRGGECNTRLMHCRQQCSDTPAATR